jgi:hypothetical protein
LPAKKKKTPSEPAAPRHRLFAMSFAKLYPALLNKVERKDRSKKELDHVICWLTGHTTTSLQKQIKGDGDVESFFNHSPAWNPASKLVTGTVCGVRVEDVPDPLMRRIRRLDKLVDELAKGKAMEKILRQ